MKEERKQFFQRLVRFIPNDTFHKKNSNYETEININIGSA